MPEHTKRKDESSKFEFPPKIMNLPQADTNSFRKSAKKLK